jgi:stage V sporulation protein B
MKVPVINAIAALVLHVAFLLLLMFGFKMTIAAVVLANSFYALLMCIMNGVAVSKYTKYRQEIVKTFVIPVLSAVVMGAVVYLLFFAMQKVLGTGRAVVCVETVVAILVGIVVYGIFMIFLKGLTEEELKSFPKGDVIIRLLKKLHLLHD